MIRSWVTNSISLKANLMQPYRINDKTKANVVLIVNPSSHEILAALDGNVSSDSYEERIPGGLKGILIRSNSIDNVYFLASADIDQVYVHEIAVDDPLFVYQLLTMTGNVVISATPALKASELHLDAQKDLQVDVLSTAGLLASQLNLDEDRHLHVDIETQPDPAGWTWALITAAAPGDVEVKATPGRVARMAGDGVVTVYLKDGTSQAWKTGDLDFGNSPLACATKIVLNFSAAGTAWILYK